MIVQMISSVQPNILLPNLVWWCIIMSQSVMQKHLFAIFMSRSQQGLIRSKYDCFYYIFWTADPFAFQPGFEEFHYKPVIRSTDLGPVIVLPTGVAFQLVSRALSWWMCATEVLPCVCLYCLDVGWTPRIIEMLDVGGCGFIYAPQPQCFFHREALAFAELILLEVRVSCAGNDQSQESLICLQEWMHTSAFAACSSCQSHWVTDGVPVSMPSASAGQSGSFLQAQVAP